MCLVRESAHTIALASGSPVRRLHATVVSRWFVIPIAVYPFARTAQIDPRRTYDLDAALLVSGGLDAPYGFVDAIVACLYYLVGIVLVPPTMSLHLSVGYSRVRAGLTQVQDNTGEIRSGAEPRCWHNGRRL